MKEHCNIRVIPLTNGQYTFVDVEDYDWLSQWKWKAVKHIKKEMPIYYVNRNEYYGIKNKKPVVKTIVMAREIMKTPKGMVCDHINHNTLDNTKRNLRNVTERQNHQNLLIGKSSKYTGVSWHSGLKKWGAYIKIKQNILVLGYWPKDQELEAAKAYEAKVRELGEELVCKLGRK